LIQVLLLDNTKDFGLIGWPETSLDNRTISNRAEDAVRTAVRQSGREDIDISIATESLLSALEEETLGGGGF
jgi:hypothetical protein